MKSFKHQYLTEADLPGDTPGGPKKLIGVLRHDMIVIVIAYPGSSTAAHPVGAVLGNLVRGSGFGFKIYTPEEAKSDMHRLNADRGPNQNKIDLHPGILLDKGTSVVVRYWGPGGDRVTIRPESFDTQRVFKTWRPKSELPDFPESLDLNIDDDQLTKYRGEELEDVIARWVDFSKISNTKNKLKRLR